MLRYLSSRQSISWMILYILSVSKIYCSFFLPVGYELALSMYLVGLSTAVPKNGVARYTFSPPDNSEYKAVSVDVSYFEVFAGFLKKNVQNVESRNINLEELAECLGVNLQSCYEFIRGFENSKRVIPKNHIRNMTEILLIVTAIPLSERGKVRFWSWFLAGCEKFYKKHNEKKIKDLTEQVKNSEDITNFFQTAAELSVEERPILTFVDFLYNMTSVAVLSNLSSEDAATQWNINSWRLFLMTTVASWTKFTNGFKALVSPRWKPNSCIFDYISEKAQHNEFESAASTTAYNLFIGYDQIIKLKNAKVDMADFWNTVRQQVQFTSIRILQVGTNQPSMGTRTMVVNVLHMPGKGLEEGVFYITMNTFSKSFKSDLEKLGFTGLINNMFVVLKNINSKNLPIEDLKKMKLKELGFMFHVNGESLLNCLKKTTFEDCKITLVASSNDRGSLNKIKTIKPNTWALLTLEKEVFNWKAFEETLDAGVSRNVQIETDVLKLEYFDKFTKPLELETVGLTGKRSDCKVMELLNKIRSVMPQMKKIDICNMVLQDPFTSSAPTSLCNACYAFGYCGKSAGNQGTASDVLEMLTLEWVVLSVEDAVALSKIKVHTLNILVYPDVKDDSLLPTLFNPKSPLAQNLKNLRVRHYCATEADKNALWALKLRGCVITQDGIFEGDPMMEQPAPPALKVLRVGA